MRLNIRLFGILLAAVGLAQAQAFEAASIKPSGAQSVRGSDGGPGSRDPSLYRFGLATMLDLICVAYDVQRFQISSSAPLDKQSFDLAAKIPEGATKEQFRVMLQNLLAERFLLKTHLQSKEFAAYELKVAKMGPKLSEKGVDPPQSSSKDDWPELPRNRPTITARFSSAGGFTVVRLMSRQKPLSDLARMLRTADDLPIVDRTGLTGKYDFNLEYTLDIPGATVDGPPVAPGIFSALPQQLGLQLVRAKVPFDVVVVESVNKLPVEN
jgi:uncharacterized protein (TIGR03435 family)